MKNLSLITWITQLGLTVALPPVGFILLAIWLRSSLGWGSWVLWVGIILGLYCAVQGFCSCLRTLLRLSDSNEKKDKPISYNDHS